MYQEKKIISTAVSNNRLNFDERTNRSIIVPSLIEGTFDDIVIGTETVIEAEIGGKIVAGKGLKNFVFLKNAQVPTWIMDNHNHAFAFWHEAYWKGCIQKGSLLVHIDQHTDLATPMALPMKNEEGRMKNGKSDYFNTLEEVENYTNTDLTIADFIVPALSTGLISEALIVTGEDKVGVGIFSWNGKLTKRNSENILEHPGDYPSIIVDIDLDYFSQGFDETKTLEITKYWIEKADIITIATSPLFIAQEKALGILKSLQKNLVAL